MNTTRTVSRAAALSIALASALVIVLACVPSLRAADAPAVPAAAAPPGAGAAASAAPESAPATAAPATDAGLAAVYSDRLHGRKTASGETYDRDRLTAAHKTLPFGTTVKVTNVKNRKTVTLRINDRGPTQPGRVLDISPKAAKALGISPRGMAEVTVEVVDQPPARGTK
jgi:rare lipoprotein A